MAQSQLYGVYIPTNFVWDVQRLQQIEVTSPEFKELLVRLYQNLNYMVLALNVKDTGVYEILESINNQLFFSNPALNSSTAQLPDQRPVYRKVFNFGALPNTGTKSVPHGITITANTSFTRIYGVATDPSTSFIPIPYASCTDVAHNVELNLDATNVNIITGIDRTAYTTTYVIVEYLQT